jgi:hypothetical protein
MTFASNVELTGQREKTADIITHLILFEANLRRARGIYLLCDEKRLGPAPAVGD